jgi:cbb3-type cytochrome oxidase maturation protein
VDTATVALACQKNSIVSVLFILIGVSILVAVGFLAAFIWNVKRGQYDDDYTPSVRILFDDNTDINTNDNHPQDQNNK